MDAGDDHIRRQPQLRQIHLDQHPVQLGPRFFRRHRREQDVSNHWRLYHV